MTNTQKEKEQKTVEMLWNDLTERHLHLTSRCMLNNPFKKILEVRFASSGTSFFKWEKLGDVGETCSQLRQKRLFKS